MKIQIVASAALLLATRESSEPGRRQRHLPRRRHRPGQRPVRRPYRGRRNSTSTPAHTAYKLIAGWRFLDWLAVEANYLDLGTADDRIEGVDIEADVSGFSLAAVGFLPIGPVDVFAKLGAVNWDAELSAPGTGLNESDDGTDLMYGVGVQFRVWSLSIRGEYEIFDVAEADTVDMISLGVTWTFL